VHRWRIHRVCSTRASTAARGARRAIDVHEGDELDEEALAELVRAAAALNATKKK